MKHRNLRVCTPLRNPHGLRTPCSPIKMVSDLDDVRFHQLAQQEKRTKPPSATSATWRSEPTSRAWLPAHWHTQESNDWQRQPRLGRWDVQRGSSGTYCDKAEVTTRRPSGSTSGSVQHEARAQRTSRAWLLMPRFASVQGHKLDGSLATAAREKLRVPPTDFETIHFLLKSIHTRELARSEAAPPSAGSKEREALLDDSSSSSRQSAISNAPPPRAAGTSHRSHTPQRAHKFHKTQCGQQLVNPSSQERRARQTDGVRGGCAPVQTDLRRLPLPRPTRTPFFRARSEWRLQNTHFSSTTGTRQQGHGGPHILRLGLPGLIRGHTTRMLR